MESLLLIKGSAPVSILYIIIPAAHSSTFSLNPQFSKASGGIYSFVPRKLYNLTLEKIEGFRKYKNLLSQYYIFIISMMVGILFLYLLTFITFDIKIMTNKSELIKIIQNELDAFNLKKYQFIKSFNEKENIKKTILNNYKDKFEWLEIDRIGSSSYNGFEGFQYSASGNFAISYSPEYIMSVLTKGDDMLELVADFPVRKMKYVEKPYLSGKEKEKVLTKVQIKAREI